MLNSVFLVYNILCCRKITTLGNQEGQHSPKGTGLISGFLQCHIQNVRYLCLPRAISIESLKFRLWASQVTTLQIICMYVFFHKGTISVDRVSAAYLWSPKWIFLWPSRLYYNYNSVSLGSGNLVFRSSML